MLPSSSTSSPSFSQRVTPASDTTAGIYRWRVSDTTVLSGTLVGAVIIARKGAREGRKTAVPFGPFLALGGVVGLFAGPDIVSWYLDTFT